MGSVSTASIGSLCKGISVAIVIVTHSLTSREKESKRGDNKKSQNMKHDNPKVRRERLWCHLAFRNLTGYTLSGDPQIQAQRAGEVFRDWLQVRRPSPTHGPASFDPWASECC